MPYPIHVYESDTAPPEYRFVAMYQVQRFLFGFQHGATANEARARCTASRDKLYAKQAKVKKATAVYAKQATAVDVVSDDLEDLF